MRDTKALRLGIGTAGSIVMLVGTEMIVRSVGETIFIPAFFWALALVIVAIVIFQLRVPQDRLGTSLAGL